MGGGIIYLVVDIQKVQGRNRAVLGVSALWSYIRRPPYRDEPAKCISAMEMVLTKTAQSGGFFQRAEYRVQSSVDVCAVGARHYLCVFTAVNANPRCSNAHNKSGGIGCLPPSNLCNSRGVIFSIFAAVVAFICNECRARRNCCPYARASIKTIDILSPPVFGYLPAVVIPP